MVQLGVSAHGWRVVSQGLLEGSAAIAQAVVYVALRVLCVGGVCFVRFGAQQQQRMPSV